MLTRTRLFERLALDSVLDSTQLPSTLQSLAGNATLSRLWRTAIQTIVVALADFLAFILAAAISVFLAIQSKKMLMVDLNNSTQQLRMIFYVALAIIWAFWFGVVKQSCINRRPYWAELQQILLTLVGFAFMDLAFIAIARADLSKTWWFTAWLLLVVLIPLSRKTSRSFLNYIHLWSRPTVIFGTAKNAELVHLAMLSEPNMGFKVRAFLEPKGSNPVNALASIKNIPVIPWNGSEAEVDSLRPYHCVIAVEADQRDFRDALIRDLTLNCIVDVHVIPAMRGVPLYGLETAQFFSHEVLLIQLRNNLASVLFRALKRTFDIVGAILLMIILSPLLAYIAFKITRDGGPAIFGHTRIGRYGVPFKCLKFRSMVVNAQDILRNLLERDPLARAEWEKDFKLKNDPRINPIGHFLRKTSLDEIPQLWNVLRGEMSLVGPRPVVRDELSRYGEDVAYYLMARPGITGLWQVSGRNDVDYNTRVYLDSWYVKNWSLWSDIVILFKTIGVVAKRSGAY